MSVKISAYKAALKRQVGGAIEGEQLARDDHVESAVEGAVVVGELVNVGASSFLCVISLIISFFESRH